MFNYHYYTSVVDYISACLQTAPLSAHALEVGTKPLEFEICSSGGLV